MALVALGAWVTRSSIFAARDVDVRGNRHLTRAEVLAAAGVGVGSNLVWFSPGGARHRLEANPWVVSAEVSRTLPSSLAITVHEREAVAVVGTTTPMLVAGDRTLLGPAGGDVRLPRIDAPPGPLRVGRLMPVSVGLEAVQPMRPSLLAEVLAVTVGNGGVVTVRLRDGATAVYGDATQAAAKASALAAVLGWAARHHVAPQRIDLRVPSRPALLPSGESVPAA